MDGNVTSFKELLSIINKLTTEDEIVEFVKKRLEILENGVSKRTIDKNNCGRLIGTINSGYINSESPIVTSYMVEPFYLNDMTLYIEFIKHIKEKEFTSILIIFYELRDFMEKTFGFKGNRINREYVYLHERDNDISIADFYKNDSALCSERSAAVQNLAEFCCISSYLVYGKMLVAENIEEHAYNIFKAKDGTLILFDPTNPVALDYGGKVGYAPAFSIIGKANICDVEEIVFDFEYISKIHNLPIHESEKDRKYRTCNYELNNQNKSDKKCK